MEDQESVEITREMADAGMAVLDDLRESYTDFFLVQEIYKAMWNCRPR